MSTGYGGSNGPSGPAYNPAPKTCPVMTQPVFYPANTTTNNQGYFTMHYVACMRDNCAMWVGDNKTGRCGMSRITDAEAMKLAMEGSNK